MGVLDDGGDPAGGGGAGPGGEVLPLGGTRIHEMNVGVDHARQHQHPRSVDHRSHRRQIGRYGCDRAVANAEVCSPLPAPGDDDSPLDGEVGHASSACSCHNL